jgi:hypothetical protein
MKKIIKSILPVFLPLALTITFLCGLLYVGLQQIYRMSANDPQIQLAEDIATQVRNGASAQYFVPTIKIDISKSLGTFIIIYDKNGKLVDGSALLNGKPAEIPSGVFSVTKQRGETRFTWQPAKGVRSAVIATYYKQEQEGFIVIGRSLREVETRIDNLGKIIFAGWFLTLTFVAILMILEKKLKLPNKI